MNEPTSQRWPATARMGFRFLFSYLVLFFLPFPSGLVQPDWLGSLFDPFWNWLVPAAAAPFHIEIPNINNGGSGDSTLDYLRLLCIVVLAVLATIVWSAIDRRRDNYRKLYAWSRIWLRYALALCMLTYGSVKVLMVQFEPPAYGRLIEPLGQLSPMALLWTFMGYSTTYTSFTGITEVIGGVLLLFRRTTTLGALIVVGAMTNVLILNISYDVPVKIGSAHILLLAIVLLAPDLRRLANFFVLNRETPPASLGPEFTSRGLRRLGLVLKAIFIVSVIGYISVDTYSNYRQHLTQMEKPPVPPEGWYTIASIKRDGQTIGPVSLSDAQWKTFSLRGSFVNVRAVDGTLYRFKTDGDILHDPVHLLPVDDKRELIAGATPVGPVALNMSDGGQATLLGTFNGHTVEAAMQRENPADMPLMKTGFRWIIESPYFH